MRKVELKEAQELMTTILRDVDRICRENNINYWIESGTLLGAVRHGGFIPWDDDIDVGMLREDYDKFLEIAPKELPEDLFIQNAKNENVSFTWTKVRHKFSKIVEEDKVLYRDGFFIDIFPYDVYKNNIDDERFLLKDKLFRNKKIVFNSMIEFEKPIFKNIIKNIKRFLIKMYNKCILKWDMNKMAVESIKAAYSSKYRLTQPTEDYMVGYGIELFEFKNMYDNKILFPLNEIEFEGVKVFCPKDADTYLKCLYGENYMEIPPQEDRYSHNLGIYIDKVRE